MANKITYGINFNVNQTQLNQLKAELKNLQQLSVGSLTEINPKISLEDAKAQINSIHQNAIKLEQAFNKAFNTNLGTLNLKTLNNEFDKLGIDIKTINRDLSKTGIVGIQVFQKMSSAIMGTQLQLRESYKLLDSMATTMGNTIKWGITSRIFNEMASSVQEAWTFTKELDTSLNNIRIVTGKSADEMERFARVANNAAQNLGKSTKDYTDAALIYYQQGLSDIESQKRAEVTLKTANVTGQSTSTVSEQLTSVWNGYKVATEQTEMYVDKLAAVAADTAADLEELSVGMSKVASAASIMGVDIDQLSASLATVISVTRQAPETVGTAFKTIYARMGDISAGIDTETSLDKYTQDMYDIADINVLDANNKLRDMGEVIEEVGNKWSSMTREQQIALSQVMAGTRQYNNLLSLFDNWDMYTDALETSKGSLGELNRQQDIYMESTEAHLEKLGAAWERVFDSFTDNEGINGLIDIFTGLTNGIANFTEAIGGGGKALLAFGTIGTKVFSKNLAQGINTFIKNQNADQNNANEIQNRINALEKLQKRPNIAGQTGKDPGVAIKIQELVKLRDNIKGLNTEQIETFTRMIDNLGNVASELNVVNLKIQQAKDFLYDIGKSQNDDSELFSKNLISRYLNGNAGIESSKEIEDAIFGAQRDNIRQQDLLKRTSDQTSKYNIRNDKKTTKGLLESYDALFTEAETMFTSPALKKQIEEAINNVYTDIDISESGRSLADAFTGDEKTFTKRFTDAVLKRAEQAAKIINQAVDENAQKLNNLTNVKNEGANNLKEKANIDKDVAQENLNSAWEDIDTQKATQSLINLATGAASVASAFMTLINIGDIFTNDDLTTGEKFLQIILALGTAVPMLASGFKDVTDGIGTLTTELPKLGAQLKGVIVAKQQQMQASANAAAAETTLTGATAATTGATTAATGATVSFGSALAATLAPILAIVAVVAVLGAAIYALVKAYNADAEAAQRANEVAEKLNDRYNELKTSAEEFKKTISEYSDGIKALEELETHTNEYKEALESANEKAKELIETYGLWNDYEIKNGLITIDPDVLNKAQNKADSTARNVETTAYVSRMSADQAALKLQRTELSRQIGALEKAEYTVKRAGGITRYVEGTTYEAKERLTETNQLSDASIQQIADGLNKIKTTDSEQYDLLIGTGNEEQLKNAILNINGLNQATKENIEQIMKQKDALIALTESTYKQNEAAGYYTSQIMQNEVEARYGTQLEKISTNANGEVDQARYNQLLAITSQNKEQQNTLENKLNNITLDKKYTSNNSLSNYGYNIKNDEDLARTYAKEVLGYTQNEIDKMSYKGGTGKGTLKSADGKTVVLDEYSDEQMRQQLAKQSRVNAITKEYSDNLDEQSQINALNELIKGATKAGEKYGTDFTDALLNSLTAEGHVIDLSGLFAEIDPSEYEAISKMSDPEILELMGMDKETLEKAGYASAEEFITNFKAGLNNYKWDVDKALDSAIGKRDDNYEELDLETEDVKDYAKHLMEMAKASEELSDELAVNADASALVSEYVIRMNKGIQKLADGFDDWSDVLKKSSNTSEEYSDALTGIQDSLADIIGVEANFISNDYVVEHLDDIKKAAEGNEEAIDRLKTALSEDIILKVMAEGEIDVNKQQEVLGLVQKLQKQIPTVKIGTEIDMNDAQYADFFNMMQDIVTTAGLTAEQANALFGTMGFETEFVTESQPVKKTGHGTRTVMEFKGKEKVTMPDGSTMEIPSGWETKTYPGEAYEYVDYVDAIAMSTDGKTPKLKKVTKKASSSMNNYSSSNKGGGSPKKSSGSKKEPNKMDKLDKTPDRYHKVNTQLSKIGNQLDKIQSQEKKLTGVELIKNINAQLGQLDNRLDQLREKVKIAQGETKELKDSLANQGVQFNDDGTIANYMEIYKSKVAYVNSLIDKYNMMSAEEQEKYKETVEQAKEDLDRFTEDLDRYDELVSDFIPGLSNEIQDAIDQEIELNIKKFNLEFDVRLNMKDATKDWNEFKKRILDGIDEDDIYGNAKARATDDFSNMISENGVQASTKQAQEVLAELKEMDATGWSDVYGDDRVSALEDLKTAYETINEDLMEINQIQKDVYQAWLDTMDEINDKMADQVAMYEQVSNLIDHDMKVIQLIYGETDYEALGEYYDKQHQNNLDLLDFQRQNADFWEKEMNSIDKERDPDAWKKARDNWISAVNDLNATVETSIENARNKMENTIDDIFQKFNNNVTDGKGLDYLAQQWDLVNDNADNYLDTVNAAFGIRQLESKYQDAIDLTDNVSAQRKLNDLMKSELKALKEKDKLTEYDIERANMRYEIALKQIALEEAQQTKTTMRLRRDSQGNYRYEYIADEDAIGKLRDELDVLENSLYNFDKERWIEMQNQVVDAVQERQDAIKEIMMDASLSEEERAERLAEINRLYNEKIQNITEQTVEAQKNLYESGTDELEKDFGELSSEQGRIMVEEMLPQFNTGVNEMIDKFSGPGGFEDLTTQSMSNLSQATQDYNQDLADIEQNAGTVFDEVENGIDKNIHKTEQLIENNDALNAEYEEQIERIKDLNLKLQEQADKYKKIAEEAKKATQEAYNYWMEQQRQAAEAAENAKAETNGESSSGNQNSNPGNAGGNIDQKGSGAGSGNGTPDVGEYATYLGGTYYETSGGSGAQGQRGVGKRVKITAVNSGAAFPIHVMSSDSAYGWLKKSQLSGYDTGGYTGEWAGGYGKLALLHSKELVLNAQDTENMLDMMQIARDVIALAGPRVGALSAGKGAGAAMGQLEQNVHIEANFPNVESASEIEEALNNLVQLASQRATRNTRG